jgi:hypothetical protein
MSKRKPIQIECSIHGARGCECSSSLAEQKNAKKKKRSKRRSDQQRARDRREREGGSYRQALLGPKPPKNKNVKQTMRAAMRPGKKQLAPLDELRKQMAPAMQAVETLRNSPVMQTVEALRNSPVMQTVEALRNSPVMQTVEALRNSPVMHTLE